jgi:hypothetical protein
VQLAANSSNLEAALKLVEGGASWQRSKAQRIVGTGLHYAPDILCAKMPHLKVSHHAVIVTIQLPQLSLVPRPFHL